MDSARTRSRVTSRDMPGLYDDRNVRLNSNKVRMRDVGTSTVVGRIDVSTQVSDHMIYETYYPDLNPYGDVTERYLNAVYANDMARGNDDSGADGDADIRDGNSADVSYTNNISKSSSYDSWFPNANEGDGDAPMPDRVLEISATTKKHRAFKPRSEYKNVQKTKKYRKTIKARNAQSLRSNFLVLPMHSGSDSEFSQIEHPRAAYRPMAKYLKRVLDPPAISSLDIAIPSHTPSTKSTKSTSFATDDERSRQRKTHYKYYKHNRHHPNHYHVHRHRNQEIPKEYPERREMPNEEKFGNHKLYIKNGQEYAKYQPKRDKKKSNTNLPDDDKDVGINIINQIGTEIQEKLIKPFVGKVAVTTMATIFEKMNIISDLEEMSTDVGAKYMESP